VEGEEISKMNRQEAIKRLSAAGKAAEVQKLIGEQVSAAQRRYEQISGDTRLSDDFRRHKLAAAFVSARDKLEAELVERASRVVVTDREDASTVLGIEGLPGDRASLIISRRDAADRVAAISDRSELREMLRRATRTGDEVLARAVAERALEERDEKTMNLFLEDRPDLDERVNRLWKADQFEDAAMELTLGMLPLRPTELQQHTTSQVELMAARVPAEPPATRPASQTPMTTGRAPLVQPASTAS
jgi:hypothetical protein